MAKLAAPKAKRAAKHGPDGGGPKGRTRPVRAPRAATPAVGVLQPKLRVSEPDDHYEREADRVADRVMSAPAEKAQPALLSGRETEEKEPLQRAAKEEEETAQTAALQREEAPTEEEETAQTFSLQREEKETSEEQTAQTFALQREEVKAGEEEETAQAAPLQRAAPEEDEAETPAVQRQESPTEPPKEEEETAQTSPLQRQEEKAEEVQTAALQRRADEEEEQMQQRAKHPRRPRITPRFEASLKLLRHGGGQPLPDSLRSFLEPRFGRSLADVRAHVGPEAAALAREANARAFTVGHHIVFGAGEFRPGVEQGRRLIAHELTHVFQQRGGLHSVQREVGPDRAAAASTVRLPSIEELRAAFDLNQKAAPASVLSVAVEMLRSALRNQSDAARLGPLTEAEGGTVVRRIESGPFTLELSAAPRGGSLQTSWKLTHRARGQTFVSRTDAAGGQWPGASSGADVKTISLTAPPTKFPPETLASRLEGDRPGVPKPPAGPPPLVPKLVPAASLAGAKPKPPSVTPKPKPAAPPPAVEPGAPKAPEPVFEPEPAADAASTPAEPSAAAAAPGAAATPEAGAEGGEAPAEEAHAPRTPEEDPDFQKTAGQVRRTRKAQGTHQPSDEKLSQTDAASNLPEAKQQADKDRNAHLDDISKAGEETKKMHFTPESFKEMLKKSIDAIKLPKSEGEADRFKKEKPLEAAKKEINSQVKQQNEAIAGPLAEQVKSEEPPKREWELEKPSELTEEEAGKRPRPINPTAAAPKPRLDSEISFEKESQSLDDKMAEYELTETQLDESNEDKFKKAADSKREAQQKAAEAPGVYREQETQVLADAQGTAGAQGARGFGGMFKTRKDSLGEVFGKQDKTAAADKAEQTRIQTELARIYNDTKCAVDTKLEKLSEAVDLIFSVRVEAAKATFESEVEEQIDDIYGVTVVDDWIFGADTDAIERVFQREQARFLKTMDGVIDDIAKLIADTLNSAMTRIQEGRTEAKKFYDGLDEKQKQLSKEAFDLFNSQFDILEDSVREKEQELADSLAESYQSNVDSLRESFDKIKEEISRGWIGAAIDFIKEVGTLIKKLGELLMSVLSRVGNVIGDILAHPIRFIENLASGIGQGFDQFIAKIDDYLLEGFFKWLRGAAGPAIQLPEKLDAGGLFDLMMQVLGLTYENFRKIAVKVWGKDAVEMLEKGLAVAEKGLEIFHIVREKGLAGLWEYIQAHLTSLVEDLIEKVKETVLYATIEKALAFVAGLFTPVGAFIKAAQTIYRGVRFLIDNIDRIAEIVDAFLTSVELAVAGKPDAIAQKIINALREFIVVGIDFLAKLLGLGDLAAKLRKILKAIQQPFERAIEAVLRGLKALVKGVMRKLGIGKKPEEQQAAQQAQDAAQAGRELSHDDLLAEVAGAMAKPTEATEPGAALAEKKKQAETLETTYQPMLKEGTLKITIQDPNAEKVAEDSAVDFSVEASPALTGQAPVRIEVGDEKVVQQRFSKARTLKKFTSEKGFVVDDWATTFKLSHATHLADLRYGVDEELIEKKDGGGYRFKSDVPPEEIADRGALEIQKEAIAYFKKGRFGIPLIQTFLTGRKIAGIPPETFDDRALVAKAAERAELAGAIVKAGDTGTWALPKMPAVRTLPEGWKGAEQVRYKFYERGSGFRSVFEHFADQEIVAEVEGRIDALINDPSDMRPWQELVKLGLTKPNEKFDLRAAERGDYTVRGRYDVDHIVPLAQHWNARGHNTGQPPRTDAVLGAPAETGLQLLEGGVNRRKSSEGVEYQLWVGPNFKSENGNQYQPDGDEFYQEYDES